MIRVRLHLFFENLHPADDRFYRHGSDWLCLETFILERNKYIWIPNFVSLFWYNGNLLFVESFAANNFFAERNNTSLGSFRKVTTGNVANSCQQHDRGRDATHIYWSWLICKIHCDSKYFVNFNSKPFNLCCIRYNRTLSLGQSDLSEYQQVYFINADGC